MDNTNTHGLGPARGAATSQPTSRRLRLVLLLPVITLIAAACASGSTGTAAESTAPGSTDTTPEVTAAAVESTSGEPTANSDAPVEESESAGALTINTEARFNGETVVGTFVVDEGADVLGCQDGTFEDAVPGPVGIDRIFTCGSGDRSGTILVRFDFDESDGGVVGLWEVQGATGDFVGLSGGGDFSANLSDMESFVGEISYDS